ncbi:hypothetical protein ABNF65_20085 [Paenibacillus larvae]
MDINSFITEYNLPVTIVPSERKYWLVRTQSGEFYEEFFHENFIAINWDEFSDIEKFKNSEKDNIILEIERYYKSYPPDKQPQPGRIYGQIYRFLFELNIGDIVMIPSLNSAYISFGIITSDTYIEKVSENSQDLGLCPYKKRRKVKWLRTVQRNKLDPYLYKMMNTHHTISNADDYAHFIDRTLHSFYVKDNKAFFVVHVNQEKDIPAIDIINYVSSVLDLVPLVQNPEEPDKEFTKDQIELKMNVQSPGLIEFSSQSVLLMIIVGGLLISLVGGKIKFTRKVNGKEEQQSETGLEVESEGLFEKLIKFTKQHNEHKLEKIREEHALRKEKIKADLPQDVVKKLDQ